MVLLTFHYITTAFFLGVWLGYPRNIPWVLVIHFLLQMILFLSGFDWQGIDAGATFWGWQTLASFEGVVIASLFLICFRSKHTFLELKVRYERVWFTWLVSTAAFVGAQIFYSEVENSDFGLLFTILATIVVLIGTGYSLLFDEVVFTSAYEGWGRKNLLLFMGYWILHTVSMQALFYLVNTGLRETWVAFISGGGPALILILMKLFCTSPRHVVINKSFI